ncbi:MAG: IS110 family transposase [Microthrixaceae bacterium]
MTIVADPPAPVDTPLEVTVGVDTHADTHVAAVIDPLGRHLAHASFGTTVAGYESLLEWATRFGTISLVGVEGTGAYGAGLARFLGTKELMVVEVDRPDRKTRRTEGKSDPIDAYAAARAAASGRASGIPKARTGDVESVRVLRVARTSAIRDRAKALTRLKALRVSAPDALRAQLADLNNTKLVATCARLRPARHGGRLADTTAATKRSMASIAARIQALTTEIADLDADLEALLAPLAPTLLDLQGVGPDSAGQLLVTTGDNPSRIRNQSAFAHLCGVAPIPASSGKTGNRHRLNRGGDRQANASLHRIVLCRLRWDPTTRAYVERRTQEGLTKKEIIRCLKRFVAREVFAAIQTDLNPQHSP